MAVFISGALGFERGRKRHPAGFRTYILVCLGATLVMMTNQYIFGAFHTGDVSRLGAQVISGIGFLGAGTIIITGRNQVRGLTTAAGLWAAACVGLAIGIGFYEGALVGGTAIFCVMTILNKVDEKLKGKAEQLDFFLVFNHPSGLGKLIGLLKDNKMQICDLQITKNKSDHDNETSVILSIKTAPYQLPADAIQLLGSVEELTCIEEVEG